MPAIVADIVAYCLDNLTVTAASQAVSSMYSQASSGKPLGPAHRGLCLGGHVQTLSILSGETRVQIQRREGDSKAKKGPERPFFTVIVVRTSHQIFFQLALSLFLTGNITDPLLRILF